MRAFHAALAIRLLYLALIVRSWINGGWRGAISLIIIFTVTLPVLYLGKNDWRFAISDILFMGLSALGALSFVVGWDLKATILGVDKIFHMAGGAAAGIFAYFALRNEVKTGWILFLLIPTVALAIGAGWEVFEYFMYLLGGQPDTYFNKLLFTDAILDLIADTIGGVLVAIVPFLKK